MRRMLSPTVQISFALTSLTLSLLLTAQVFGFLPSQSQGQLNARARIAEALAIQLSTAAGNNDIKSIQATLEVVAQREPTMVSAAIRKADGTVLAQSGQHPAQWIETTSHRSTATHIIVPIRNAQQDWGRVEIVFEPLSSSMLLGLLPSDVLPLLLFLGLIGFVGYYFVLRNALREIDPGNAIHQRVQAAFNALTEGVLVIDDKEKILLANTAISDAFGQTPEALLNKRTNVLNWRQWSSGDDGQQFPWLAAMETGVDVTGTSMSIRTPSGDVQLFSVNAAPIIDGRGGIYGAIATFDNVTDLQRMNEQLRQANRQLKETQSEVRRQNHELRYLASRDTLSGCLNRRSLFEGLKQFLDQAQDHQLSLAIIMVDIDHFKSINDTYGHTAGDEVIANVGAVLRNCSRKEDLVGRYGGEEFCLAILDTNHDEAAGAAERIRRELALHSQSWLRDGRAVTASLGVALLDGQSCSETELIDQADRALYEAKQRGRNRVMFWRELDLATDPGPSAVDQAARRDKEPAAPPPPRQALEPLRPDPEASSLSVADRPGDVGRPDNCSLPATQEANFLDHLTRSIARAKRQKFSIAVLHLTVSPSADMPMADLADMTSAINAATTTRASSVLRRSDTISLCGPDFTAPLVSQLGDSAFGIEISDLENVDSVTWIVKRLFKALSTGVVLNGQQVDLNATIGIAIYPRDGTHAHMLLDSARAAADQNGHTSPETGYTFHSGELNQRSRKSLQIEAGLRRALQSDELSLAFQPILNVETGVVTSAEGLMRCHRDELREHGVVELIAVAEQTGLIIDIGEKLLGQGMALYRDWLDKGLHIPKLSLNVSPVQLRDSAASERLIQFVHGLDIAPNRLQFEVTETTFIDDVCSVRESLERLQNLGVQIALDDFGTGHSSLSHLREFQPDVLKIDRSFIDRIETSRTDVTMVSAIIAMCHQMGIVVVAEGVESEAQLHRLKYLQCDDFQGFLGARPMSGAEFTRWLEKQATAAEAFAA